MYRNVPASSLDQLVAILVRRLIHAGSASEKLASQDYLLYVGFCTKSSDEIETCFLMEQQLPEYLEQLETIAIPILDVGLSVYGSGMEIFFETRLGGQSSVSRRWTVNAAEFGIPEFVIRKKFNYAVRDFSLSNELVTGLASQIDSMEISKRNPLWLKIREPSGYLKFVPWERLISKWLERDVPILRLARYKLEPKNYGADSDIVICGSVPASRGKSPFDLVDSVKRLMRSYRRSLSSDFTAHVFADALYFDELSAWQSSDQEFMDQTIIYDPSKVSGDYHRQNKKKGSWNVWLDWIENSLESSNRFADAVHFLCHGYFKNDQGLIAVAETPTINEDLYWSRFIDMQDLSRFLGRVGAWSCFLTAPMHNFSNIGTRTLAADLAMNSAVDVVCHEAEFDPSYDELCEVQKFVFGKQKHDLHDQNSCIVYCQPHAIERWAREIENQSGLDEESESNGGLVETFKVTGDLRKAFDQSKMEPPEWAYSAQIYLERQSVESMNVMGKRSKRREIADRAKVETLKKIQELMFKSVQNAGVEEDQ